jgi:GTPase SAR1 family protein
MFRNTLSTFRRLPVARTFSSSAAKDSQNATFFTRAASLALTGAGFLFYGSAAAYIFDYKSRKESVNELFGDVKRVVSPDDIKNRSEKPSRIQELEDAKKYIPRPDLEETIMSILEKKESDETYVVLYGPKGCGKSLLIEKCINNRKGVVSVLVSSVFEKSAILEVLASKIMGKGAPTATEEELQSALKGAKVDGRLATLVFEIERGDNLKQIECVEAVRSLSKQFAQVCNCIIVLSEAKAIMVFGRDPERERYILVPNLTVDQAKMFIKSRRGVNTVVDEEEEEEKVNKRLFDNVGTNPAMLLSFVNRQGGSPDDFIQQRLDFAKQDLLAFPLKPILKALKIHPDGVRPAHFKNEEYKGIDMSNPKAVGMAMGSNAILYDIKEVRYKLMSQAHKVALRNYEPICNNEPTK